MIIKESINAAGMPRLHHIYAVFDDDEACRHASQELIALGIEPEQLQCGEAALFEHSAKGAGIRSALERMVKQIGGESHMATIYAHHLGAGRTMLAMRVPRTIAAAEIALAITTHGGYEVTYFRNWGIEYLSSKQNVEHGLPTHCETNADE